MRADGRREDELRPIRFETGFNMHAAGACIIEMGNTRVHCTATIEEGVPRWLRDSGRGWVTAEYSMLPGSTNTRTRREKTGVKGRTAEIQRLIGRSLRAVVDLEAMGPRQITVDCDVLQADGGTRTASINGGFVALALAFKGLMERGELSTWPLKDAVGAVSLGILSGAVLLDLPYSEDVAAEVDLNLVMSGRGGLIEVQGTAEEAPFSREELVRILDLGAAGIGHIVAAQEAALGGKLW
jgi:ribonuclease PH